MCACVCVYVMKFRYGGVRILNYVSKGFKIYCGFMLHDISNVLTYVHFLFCMVRIVEALASYYLFLFFKGCFIARTEILSTNSNDIKECI